MLVLQASAIASTFCATAHITQWPEVMAPLTMLAVAILPLPAEAPAMYIGTVFSPAVAVAVTWTAAFLGACISYEVASRTGGVLLRRWLKPHTESRMKRVIESGGWQGLLILRFTPLAAFTAVNWFAGFGGVPRSRFYWTTALGIVPGAVAFTLAGPQVASSLGDSWLLTIGSATVAFMLLAVFVRKVRRSGSHITKQSDKKKLQLLDVPTVHQQRRVP